MGIAFRLTAAISLSTSLCNAQSAPVMPIGAPNARLLAPPAPRDTVRVALAVSGGISKGSYQAGVMYGLLQAIRSWEDSTQMEGQTLVAVTGASAGNINALLTALDYCRIKLPRADSSALAQAWLPVGYQSLLVDRTMSDGERARQGKLSALLRSDFLGRVIGSRVLEQMPKTDFYRPGCRVPIGITVTRSVPGTYEVGNSIEVPNSRFAVVAGVETQDDGGIRLRRLQFDEPSIERGLGALIDLETSCDGTINPNRFLDAVLASAAFPVAFPAVSFDYSTRRPGSPALCKGPPQERGRFLDGGVFDNNPLDLLGGLVEANLPASDVAVVTLVRSLTEAEATLRAAQQRFAMDSTKEVDLLQSQRTERITIQRHLDTLGLPPDSTPPSSCVEGGVDCDVWAKRWCQNRNEVAAEKRLDLLCQAVLRLDETNARLRNASSSLQSAKEGRREAESRVSAISSQRDSARAAFLSALSRRNGLVTFYVDPDKPRDSFRDGLSTTSAGATGFGALADLRALVAGFLPSARSYELQIAARTRPDWFLKSLRQSSRSSRIVGTSLASFGAFLHRAFREHDYAVGLYDGLRHGFEILHCRRGEVPIPRCISEHVQLAALDTALVPAHYRAVIDSLVLKERALFARSRHDSGVSNSVTDAAAAPTPKHGGRDKREELLSRVFATLSAAPVGPIEGSRCNNLVAVDRLLCATALDSLMKMVDSDRLFGDSSWFKDDVPPRLQLYQILDALVTQARFLEEANDGSRRSTRLPKAVTLGAELALHSQSSIMGDDPKLLGMTVGSLPCRSPYCRLLLIPQGQALIGTGGTVEWRREVYIRSIRMLGIVGALSVPDDSTRPRSIGLEYGLGGRFLRPTVLGMSVVDVFYIRTSQRMHYCMKDQVHSGAVGLGTNVLARLVRLEARLSPRGWTTRCSNSRDWPLVNGGRRLNFTIGISDLAGFANAAAKLVF